MAVEQLASSRVFDDNVLRDKILGYVLQDGSSVSTADVRSLRLVNQLWSQSVSRCLLEARKPLYHLHLDKDNSINGTTYVIENGKLLDKFVEAVTGPSRLQEQVPPFKIKLYCEFFREENYESLLQCFTRCGSSLIDLTIRLPRDGGSMLFVFPNLLLPKLQTCAVDFYGITTTGLVPPERIAGSINNFHFLQQIFSGCQELQQLTMWTSSADYLPHWLERLTLPATTTMLDMSYFGLESKHLELLLRNTLPSLKILNLAYFGQPLENGLIFKILEKVQQTLTHFTVTAQPTYYSDLPVAQTHFLLPEMPELEVFESKTGLLELEENEPQLENKLPKLRKLCLENQTADMFRKWTENSRLTSVMELVLHRGVKMQENALLTFPNLQILEITVCGMEFSELKCAFRTLRQLRVLRVNVAQTVNPITDMDFWDALLIGIPVSLVKVLRSENFWDKIDFNDQVTGSIRELTELQELTLTVDGTLTVYGSHNGIYLSDAAFKFALFKMTNLTKLVLSCNIRVSPETKQSWESTGREIIYI